MKLILTITAATLLLLQVGCVFNHIEVDLHLPSEFTGTKGVPAVNVHINVDDKDSPDVSGSYL